MNKDKEQIKKRFLDFQESVSKMSYLEKLWNQKRIRFQLREFIRQLKEIHKDE